MLFPTIKLYELPEQLKKYIQEKGASGISGLSFIPWVFPVFIMNPPEYPIEKFPLKSSLRKTSSLTGAATINGDIVPEGELWEVTSVYADTTGAAGTVELGLIDENNIPYRFAKKLNTTFIVWNGHIFLRAGENIRAALTIGDISLDYIGWIRYA